MKKTLAILLTLSLVLSLSTSAFAVDFTPSAEAKDAPENVGIVGEDGKLHAAII